MNIWLISLFDPTPLDDPIYPRFIGIANAATKRGHEVTHFTSTFRHTKKKHRFSESRTHSINEDYCVHFTHSMGYRKNISPKRFIAHKDYANKLLKEFAGFDKPDIIFISMPPLSTVSQVSKWANRREIPVVIDIIDPWPDSFIKDVPKRLKPFTKTLISPFYNKLIKSLGRSSAITAISKGYLEWAKQYHTPDKPTKTYYLAIDFHAIQSQIDKYKRGNNAECLRIIYAGSLGSSYDIPSIVKAAKIIEEKFPDRTKFVITGKGPQISIINEYQKLTKNLEYLGWVSKEELLRQYGLAHLGLIQHKNSLTQTITYKFFNYMSAGLPILNSLQSEMADLIENEKLGLNNNEQDVNALVKNIETYLDNPDLLLEHRSNALAFTAKHGDMDVVYSDLVAFLEQHEAV